MNLILPTILLVSHHQIVLRNIQQRPQVVLASSPWALTLILQNWLLQVLQYLCYPLLVLNQLENLLLHPFLQLDRIYILVHDNFHRILKKKKIMELLITFKTSKTVFSSQKQPTGVLYKKIVPKNFAKFTGKHLCWSTFLISCRDATSLKRDSNTGVFLWILRNF